VQVDHDSIPRWRDRARESILSARMIKWLVTIFLALAVLAIATPWLERLGVGRLPGDLKFTARGRVYFLPIASTLVFCAVAWLIGRLI